MRTWFLLSVPVVLFCSLLLLLALHGGAADWPEHAFFRCMPYVLLMTALLLGILFGQSRVSFISLALAAVTYLTSRFYFTAPCPAKGAAVVLLAAICIPSLMAIFYHLPEKAVFALPGAVRGLSVSSVILVMFLLPEMMSFREAAFSPRLALFGPVSVRFHVPLLGALAFAACFPLLLLKKEHESPLLGPIFCEALLFVFAALDFRSGGWRPGLDHAVLPAFMSGAALTLVWSVLETSWRSANIDELTGLPGRRPLKRHLAGLGSSYAIALVDVDHFKRINDRFGHKTGDQVLRYIAAHLEKSGAGRAYRYGGEEFVVVSDAGGFEDTVAMLDGLRESICGRKFKIRSRTRPRGKPASAPVAAHAPHQRRTSGDQEGKYLAVTVSIGVARRNSRHLSPAEVLEAADRALYRAKKKGRNRVVKVS